MSDDHDFESARLRKPPHSIEAEQSVIGCLLLDPCAIDACGGLPASAFYRYDHRAIFTSMLQLIESSKSVDAVSLVDHLERQGELEKVGGAVYIDALSRCVSSARHAAQYAAIVKEKATLRALIAASDEVATAAFGGTTAAEVTHRAAGLIANIQRQQISKLPRSIAAVARERIDHYGLLERGEVVPGWPTHIPKLDQLLNGGLRPGAMYVLAARPSVGKSSFAQHVAMTLAGDGKPTLFLSLEMSEGEVADRAVSSAGQIRYSDLLSGQMGTLGWSGAVTAADALARKPFFVDDQGALTLHDIRAKARSVPGLKVLVLDYLQLCSSTQRDSNRNSEIEELSRGLKSLAKDMDIAVIALSQLSRRVEDRATKRPTLSDLRDSGAIEQDADVVLMLWPVREFKSEGRKILGLGIDKNRQGECAEFGLDFYGAFQRWGESTADISPAKAAPRSKDGFE